MPLSNRENYLRNARFEGPQWIPYLVCISDASWDQWRAEMERVALSHPTIFPGIRPGWRDYNSYAFDLRHPAGDEFAHAFGPGHRAGEDLTDAWGCVWRGEIDGLEGLVVGHPLADWQALEAYSPPDPQVQWDRQPADWQGAREQAEAAMAAGKLVSGGLPHGFFFLRLCDLRGFENLMLDMASEAPRLDRLIALVLAQSKAYLSGWLDLNLDVAELGDDLGAQTATIISPAKFARYIGPGYKALTDMCHERGALVALHSDGYILDFVDELVRIGIDILNPQDLVNGLDNLARMVKGRMCVRLDIDRQSVVPFGSRQEIRQLIEAEVRLLGSPQGGLELVCGIYPPTPPDNVDALCLAIEEFRTFWWDGQRPSVAPPRVTSKGDLSTLAMA